MATGTFSCWPRRLISGHGSRRELGAIAAEGGRRRALVITDRGLAGLPFIGEIRGNLSAAGVESELFSEIDPNPDEAMVHAAASAMDRCKPEILVCVGGGSPIDVGKAANVVHTHGGKVADYDIATGGITRILPKLLPLVAVPTTAGTGTEVTFVGVVTDTARRTKFGVLSPLLIPDVALLDPELTVSMPRSLTAFTGMDALTHCIEAYTSVVGFEPAMALALRGAGMIAGSLKAAYDDGTDLAAREAMLTASTMAGTAFSLNGLGACHAMAHQLSAYFGVPHGLANAALLPRVMRFNLGTCPGKFADLARAMGADVSGLSPAKAAEKALELVEGLSASLGVPRYLDELGADRAKVPELVERAMADNPITTNPRLCAPVDVEKLYLEAFRG